MNKQKIHKFLGELGVEAVNQSSNGWVTLPCPLAPWRHEKGTDSNPSFGITIQPHKKSHTNCFSCSFSGDLHDLLLEISYRCKQDGDPTPFNFEAMLQLIASEEDGGEMAMAYADDYEGKPEPEIFIFPEHWLESFKPVDSSKAGYEYLKSRGMSDQLMEELDIRFDAKEDRVCFPIRDFAGDLVGFHGRAIYPETVPTYKMFQCFGENNPMVWYGESWVDFEKPVVIVESVFDLVQVYKVYRNVMCPLTASVKLKKLKRIGNAYNLILMFDGDKAGRRAASTVGEYFKDGIVRVVDLPDESDPGSLSLNFLSKLLAKHVELDKMI